MGVHLGRFVIANPFGPFEEARLTTSLVRSWHRNETPEIQTPDYVRDNIHVSLLARAYRSFVETLPADSGSSKCRPSFYVETQGAFTRRFAAEVGPRLGLESPLAFRVQTSFDEPRVRINQDALDVQAYGWREETAWDRLAEYYQEWVMG